MTKEQQKQARKLLKATFDILQKCDNSSMVLDVLATTAIWDYVECDGHCLNDEIEDLLFELLEQ